MKQHSYLLVANLFKLRRKTLIPSKMSICAFLKRALLWVCVTLWECEFLEQWVSGLNLSPHHISITLRLSLSPLSHLSLFLKSNRWVNDACVCWMDTLPFYFCNHLSSHSGEDRFLFDGLGTQLLTKFMGWVGRFIAIKTVMCKAFSKAWVGNWKTVGSFLLD